MVMSALFGHVKGAFTGAMKNRVGHVLKANKGLLFLDEIGTLGVEVQAMLLQALETGQFLPVGSDKEESSDFQLIAATNSDLKAAVRKGAFREDLWTRIRTWSYELPRLRDRPEDIKPNLDVELERWEEENGKLLRMNKDVEAKFLSFATSPEAKWTGNFRDLKDIVERMARLSQSGFITSDVLENEINRLKQLWAREEEPGEGSADMLRSVLGEARLAKVDLIDRIRLAELIMACRESANAAEAGRKLFTAHGDANYSDLMRKKLGEFGLSFKDCKAAATTKS
jgi:transcriptional regulatory protein RtcR